MKIPKKVMDCCTDAVVGMVPALAREAAEDVVRAVLDTAQKVSQEAHYGEFATHISLQPPAQLDDRPPRWHRWGRHQIG